MRKWEPWKMPDEESWVTCEQIVLPINTGVSH